MIVAESHRGRRLLAQLDRGAELVESITALCRARGVRSGVLSVFGSVEEAEVREFDNQTRAFHPARRFSGSLTVVHLGGHISERGGGPHVEVACALAREGDNGVHVIGGRLVRARVHSVQVVIECFDDLVLRSALESGAGPTVWTQAIEEQHAPPQVTAVAATPTAHATPLPLGAAAPSPAATPSHAATPPVPAPRFEAPPSGHVVSRPGVAAPPRAVEAPSAPAASEGLTWAEVAARSAAQGSVEDMLASDAGDDEAIRPGDVIEHPRFGRCEVERIEGGGEYAQVRLRNRRLVRLSLDVIHLVREGRSEEGRRLFRAQVST